YQWQFRILDWDSYYQSTLETLTTGPVTAAIAGGEAMRRGGMTPTREDWEAGVRLAQASGTLGTALQALLEGAFRPAPPEPTSPSRPVAADIRPAQEPEVVKPKERGVTNSAREVERGPGRIQGPSALEPPPGPQPPPGPEPPPVPEPPPGPEPAMTRRRR